jgi:Ca2+-binding EF-hand superfamily protein
MARPVRSSTSRPGGISMIRLLCLLSVTGLLMSAGEVAAKGKGKGDKLEAMFKKLDTNGDGSLSKEEFAKITELRKKGEGKGKGKGVEKLYEKLNVKGDGKLTLDEFRKIKELRKKKNDP